MWREQETDNFHIHFHTLAGLEAEFQKIFDAVKIHKDNINTEERKKHSKYLSSAKIPKNLILVSLIII